MSAHGDALRAPEGRPAATLGGLAVRAAGRGWASLRWFVTSMMGDTAYATYVDHHRRVHPDTPVPDERTFWRERFAEQDRTPGSRCC